MGSSNDLLYSGFTLSSIVKSPTGEQSNPSRAGWKGMGMFETISRVGKGELEPLQFGPRLQQAKLRFLSGDSVTARDLSNALV